MDTRILDFKDDWYDVSIDMDDVIDIYLMILSGDEVLRIHRSNGQEEIVDPQEFERIESIYQGGYYIYDASDKNDIFDIMNHPEWLNRKHSDDYLSALYEMRKNAESKVR